MRENANLTAKIKGEFFELFVQDYQIGIYSMDECIFGMEFENEKMNKLYKIL